MPNRTYIYICAYVFVKMGITVLDWRRLTITAFKVLPRVSIAFSLFESYFGRIQFGGHWNLPDWLAAR